MTLDSTATPAAATDEALGRLDTLSDGNPTLETYEDLNRVYEIFNQELFDGALSPCLITLRAHGRTLGYFYPFRFVHADGRRAHEIALNPETFSYRTIEDCLSTLAHEQVHLAQHEAGTAPRRGYHNADFAARMRAIGLIASSTGGPGGRQTGEQMSHYIDPDGRFLMVVRRIIDHRFRARWGDKIITDVDPEWTPGKPDRPAGKKAKPKATITDGADAASDLGGGASPPAPAEPEGPPPAEGSPRPTQAEAIAELKTTAHPGGEPPMLVSRPDLFQVRGATPDPKRRIKYACPSCAAAAWGKPHLHLMCGSCRVDMPSTTPMPAKAASSKESEEE